MTNETREKVYATIAQALADCLELIESDTNGTDTSNGLNLYGVPKLAEILGKSKETVRRWISEGEFGTPVFVGKTPKVTEAGLQAYLERHTEPQGKEPRSTYKRTPRTCSRSPRL